jgi:hypothetical protein
MGIKGYKGKKKINVDVPVSGTEFKGTARQQEQANILDTSKIVKQDRFFSNGSYRTSLNKRVGLSKLIGKGAKIYVTDLIISGVSITPGVTSNPNQTWDLVLGLRNATTGTELELATFYYALTAAAIGEKWEKIIHFDPPIELVATENNMYLYMNDSYGISYYGVTASGWMEL